MVVKGGYKKTEVGVIPEDWEVKCIGDFCELTSSKRIFEHDYVSVGVPFYRGKEISMLLENKPITEPYYIAESKYESIRRRWGAPMKGEILITAVGTLCNVYLIPNDEKFYFKDGNLIWLRNISSVDFKFLVYQIDNFKKEIIDKAIGSSQKALTMVVLKKQLIPLPLTLSEQTAIATVLSDTDNLIQALEKKIAKKELIKKGAMQELLEPKEGWEVKTLGEIGESIIGLTYSPNDVDSVGTLVLRSSNIQNNQLAFHDNVYVNMKLPSRVIVEENDILICVRNGSKRLIGKCTLIKKKIAGSAFGAFMTVYRSQYSKFIVHVFQSDYIQKQIDEIMGATINQITNKDLASFIVPFPPINEQNHIAQILSDMNTEIESLQEKLSKYKQLKQGLMQELLTGRIRLV